MFATWITLVLLACFLILRGVSLGKSLELSLIPLARPLKFGVLM